MKRRPSNMKIEDFLDWTIENELKEKPKDLVKDCWRRRDGTATVRGDRPVTTWNFGEGKKTYLVYQLTYMSLHKIQKYPFSSELHASHSCGNKWCMNPHHIVPKSPDQNERDKQQEPGWATYLKLHSERTKAGQKNSMPKGLGMKEKAEWILANNTYTDNDGCKIYNGSGIDEKGYARKNITIATGKRKRVELHRFIHTMMNDLPYGGDDPEDPWNAKGKGFRVAHHQCRKPSCINPDCIVLTTRAKNSQDALSYKKNVKLTEENVREMIENYLTIEEWPYGSKMAFCRQYMEKFNISETTARDIIFRHRSWKHILEEYGLV